MWTLVLKGAATALLIMGVGPLAAEETRPYNLSEPVWVDGEKVTAFVILPGAAGGDGPARPTDRYPDLKVYLVGSMDPANPLRPGNRFDIDPATGKPPLDSEGNPLPFLITPDHDDTFTRFVPAEAPVDAFGYWIIPGPAASPETVHTRDVPPESITDAPLVYEIQLDGRWQQLTDADVIEEGIATGLLEAKFSNWGGVAWLER